MNSHIKVIRLKRVKISTIYNKVSSDNLYSKHGLTSNLTSVLAQFEDRISSCLPSFLIVLSWYFDLHKSSENVPSNKHSNLQRIQILTFPNTILSNHVHLFTTTTSTRHPAYILHKNKALRDKTVKVNTGTIS
jgi:hypothetical protein